VNYSPAIARGLIGHGVKILLAQIKEYSYNTICKFAKIISIRKENSPNTQIFKKGI